MKATVATATGMEIPHLTPKPEREYVVDPETMAQREAQMEAEKAEAAAEVVQITRAAQAEGRKVYLISSPVLKNNPEALARVPVYPFYVTPHPVKQADNTIRWVEGGVLRMIEGDIITDNADWANFLKAQWPELEVHEIGADNRAAEVTLDLARARMAVAALKGGLDPQPQRTPGVDVFPGAARIEK